MAEVAAIQTPASQIVSEPIAKGEAVTQEPAKIEKIAPSLQILVQREKKALERERIAKQREQEIESKFQSLTEREAKIKEFEELKATNPTKALELLGMSYKDLTEVQLNDGNVPVDHQLKKLKDEFEQWKKSQEDGTRQAADEAKRKAEADETKIIDDFKGSINKFLDEDPKKYELIKFDGQQALVYDVIDEHYNRTIDPETGTGEILDKAAAADKVEKWLRETKYAKAQELDFFKTLLPQQNKPEVKQEPQFRPQQHRTLTNQLSATPATPRTKPITDDERVAKAIAYARGLRP